MNLHIYECDCCGLREQTAGEKPAFWANLHSCAGIAYVKDRTYCRECWKRIELNIEKLKAETDGIKSGPAPRPWVSPAPPPVGERVIGNPWNPIRAFGGPDREEVDVWMSIYASARSMGMADDFRVVDAYRVDGRWFHRERGAEKELFADYITHWMPKPLGPIAR